MNPNVPLPVRIATHDGNFELQTGEDLERFADGTLRPLGDDQSVDVVGRVTDRLEEIDEYITTHDSLYMADDIRWLVAEVRRLRTDGQQPTFEGVTDK